MCLPTNLKAILLVAIISGCTPRIVTNISNPLPTLNYAEEVALLPLGSESPGFAALLGTVKIGESGFTMKCNYEYVIDLAKLEARKYGGNLIRIIEHNPPPTYSAVATGFSQKYTKQTPSNEKVIAFKFHPVYCHYLQRPGFDNHNFRRLD